MPCSALSSLGQTVQNLAIRRQVKERPGKPLGSLSLILLCSEESTCELSAARASTAHATLATCSEFAADETAMGLEGKALCPVIALSCRPTLADEDATCGVGNACDLRTRPLH